MASVKHYLETTFDSAQVWYLLRQARHSMPHALENLWSKRQKIPSSHAAVAACHVVRQALPKLPSRADSHRSELRNHDYSGSANRCRCSLFFIHKYKQMSSRICSFFFADTKALCTRNNVGFRNLSATFYGSLF